MVTPTTIWKKIRGINYTSHRSSCLFNGDDTTIDQVRRNEPKETEGAAHTFSYKKDMIFQFNTDRTIHGDQRQQDRVEALLKSELSRYSTHISRIDVHLSDENEKKKGLKAIRCLLEAQIVHSQPIVAIELADTVEEAIAGAIHKLKNALEKIHERISAH